MGSLNWYKVCFEQRTPLHIGKKNYGVLAETRLIIPGWTIWGALVNCYGRFMGGKDDDFEEGKALFETITCFYPALLGKNKDMHVMLPYFKDGKLYMDRLVSEEQFRMDFTDTYTSTAVDPHNLTAKDQSLHETEVILPGSKKSKQRLYWVGLLGIEKGARALYKNFIEQLTEIFVGGDKGYGLGCLRYYSSDLVGGATLDEWGISDDAVIMPDKNPIRNYIKYENDKSYEVKKGRLEIIVQYNFVGPTPRIAERYLSFIPGSEISYPDGSVFRLKKGVFV